MSFNELKVAELRAAADMFAVDLDGKKTKPAIIKELDENGVTYDMYLKMIEPDAEESPVESTSEQDQEPESAPEEPKEEQNMVLVKMTRRNWSYQTRGYYFTRDHPFQLVAEDDADYLVEEDGGFQIASPKEAREYYGG
jgi:hypothetical protein